MSNPTTPPATPLASAAAPPAPTPTPAPAPAASPGPPAGGEQAPPRAVPYDRFAEVLRERDELKAAAGGQVSKWEQQLAAQAAQLREVEARQQRYAAELDFTRATGVTDREAFDLAAYYWQRQPTDKRGDSVAAWVAGLTAEQVPVGLRPYLMPAAAPAPVPTTAPSAAPAAAPIAAPSWRQAQSPAPAAPVASPAEIAQLYPLQFSADPATAAAARARLVQITSALKS